MHDPDISPDDPRLTAYALGELSGDERAAIEAALRRSAELRAVMEEIRAMTAHIQSALAAEAAEAELTEPALPFPVAGMGRGKTRVARVREARPARRGQVVAFPRPAIWLSGFAAACIAMAIVQRTQTPAQPVVPAVAAAAATPAPEATLPAPAMSIVVNVPPPAPALDPLPAPALAVEPAADFLPAIESETLPAVSGLALLEQVKSELSEASSPPAAVPPPVYFAPLAPPAGPIVTSLGASSLPVGLPTTAREPQFLLDSFSEEPAARSQAMLRLQNEDERIAQLRGTGSPAELARLLSNAQRGAQSESTDKDSRASAETKERSEKR